MRNICVLLIFAFSRFSQIISIFNWMLQWVYFCRKKKTWLYGTVESFIYIFCTKISFLLLLIIMSHETCWRKLCKSIQMKWIKFILLHIYTQTSKEAFPINEQGKERESDSESEKREDFWYDEDICGTSRIKLRTKNEHIKIFMKNKIIEKSLGKYFFNKWCHNE